MYSFIKNPKTFGFIALLLSIHILPSNRSFSQGHIQQAQVIVDSLSSPYFGGRGYGTNQDSLAAAYIATWYQSAGLSPILDTYFQEFPLQVPIHDSAPILSINGLSLSPGIEFLPYDASPSTSIADSPPIIEAGSGLFLPDQGIHEYAGKNVQGAIVVIRDEVHDSLRTNKTIRPDYLSRPVRIEIAAQLGARAVVFASQSPLLYGSGRRPVRIPAVIVDRDTLPERIREIAIHMNTRIQAPVTTSNVIGYQKGTRYPDRYIALIGHYDHLGRLGPTHYFPGANDNASGIALMANIATYFKNNPHPYSLLYIAFSGEEHGLLGSRYFVEHAPVPLDSIRFLINFDMVASGNGGLVALGGHEFAEEFELLKTINDSLQLGPLRKRRNSPNSDHFFFLQKGVRGFFIYTDKGTQPYHHIHDIPKTLNWKEYDDTFQLVRHFIEALDDLP